MGVLQHEAPPGGFGEYGSLNCESTHRIVRLYDLVTPFYVLCLCQCKIVILLLQLGFPVFTHRIVGLQRGCRSIIFPGHAHNVQIATSILCNQNSVRGLRGEDEHEYMMEMKDIEERMTRLLLSKIISCLLRIGVFICLLRVVKLFVAHMDLEFGRISQFMIMWPLVDFT